MLFGFDALSGDIPTYSKVLLSRLIQLLTGVFPGILSKYHPYNPLLFGTGLGFDKTSSRVKNAEALLSDLS